MAKEEGKPRIIVRRIRRGAHGAHHGGAWKIAYADFVTAMMAFFLLMWLLGSTTKGELQGIADYFNTPLKVALTGGSGSGDSSSILQGGGKDLTRTFGQQPKTELPDRKRNINLQAAQAQKRELARLGEVKARMQEAIDANGGVRPFKDQIRLDVTADGLRIQIIDAQNRPMFDSGSARLKDYTRDILQEVASVLNDVEYRITLSGHTDAQPYAGGLRGYSNWELSADRANACRRQLIAAGIQEKKILRVVGLADSVPFNRDDPMDPANRRISIIVMTKQAENAVLGNGPELRVDEARQLGRALPANIAPVVASARTPGK